MVDLNPTSILVNNIPSGSVIMNGIEWLLFGIIVIAAAGGWFWWYWNKKQFNKNILVNEVVGQYYEPTGKDVAKLVKLGSGGFEVLYLKKFKVYRISYGGRMGKRTYEFYIGKDGYWYNGLKSANIQYIEKEKGLVPIIVTNPTMRAQYTALEKQIDTLHGDKKNWLKENAIMLIGIGFVLVLGVIAWQIYKDFSAVANAMSGITDKQAILMDKINTLITNSQNIGSGASLTKVAAG
jgi:hypothetical protein